MFSKSLVVISSAALVAGITPSGFTPASNTDLSVVYGQVAATNGVLVDKATTAKEPTIATKAQLTGTSYAVIMIDLDIPSTQNPHTFLHWMQTDLTPSTTATTMTTVNGTVQGFTLTNTKNTSAIVAYTQPGPPAQNPLSHRYTEVLVDTSAMTSTGLAALQNAAATRVGFDINTALQAAGLTSNVVAGNSFNVSNPGPVTASTNANAGTNGANANANATTPAAATGAGGKNGGSSGTKTKGAGKNRTKTGGASKATGAGADGGGKHGGKGAKTTDAAAAAQATAATPAGAAAAAPTGNLTNAGAKGSNGTVTTSAAAAGYIIYPLSMVIGLMGAFFWSL